MGIDLDEDDQLAIGWALGGDAPAGEALRTAAADGPDAVLAVLGEDGRVAAIRAAWEAAGRPTPPQRHVHRTVVDLPGGGRVTCVSFLGDAPYTRDDAEPAFGLYLDPAWAPPWDHAHLAWPDFGVPDREALAGALGALRDRARAGEGVELGCLGGHGRTGTALACLAVLDGVPAPTAVAWARERYCPDAVETPEQEAFVAGFTAG